jgi:hypothetical protein
MSMMDGVKANFELKLLALFMSVAIWLAASRQLDVEKTFAIPVRLDNVPAFLTVAGTPPAEVRIVVAGRENDLMKQDKGDLKAVLDLSGLGPGTVFFDTRATVSLRSGLRIVRVQPSRIELRLVKKE